mmetsp:Transcript_30977/g.36150  ORF Transcript_30977/g.36150 Transcript_30977/m.36150 type:complete len:271 (-) Transcript_30977:142-954(-)
MDAILHCLRSNCLNESDSSDRSNNEDSSGSAPRHNHLDRESMSTVVYEPPAPSFFAHGHYTHGTSSSNDVDDDDRMLGDDEFDNYEENVNDNFEYNNNNNAHSTRSRTGDNASSSIVQFLQGIGGGGLQNSTFPWKKHFRMSPTDNNIDSEEQNTKNTPHLRTAHEFISSKDDTYIPTIATSEVVVPGSKLQQQMSQSLRDQEGTSGVVDMEEDECVICMDGFDDTNPRMPTICGCGENKTYFHLPCLYHWIEQSDECPSCRMKLTWQEF